VVSLLGDPQRVDVAFGMLAAYPGVPMLYAGDKIGLATMGPEYARIAIPWTLPECIHFVSSTQAWYAPAM
jgi:alpha-glucosidase